MCNDIAVSYLELGNEPIGVIRFRTTSKRNLPHLCYILRNPEPLGKDFKTVGCSVTNFSTLINIERWKRAMKNIKYHMELGATSTYMKSVVKVTKGLGQMDIKGDTKDYFIFDGWFASNRSE